MNPIKEDLKSIFQFVIIYGRRKVCYIGSYFEEFKNILVNKLISRRGVFQRQVWHGSMIGLSAFGMLTSGLFGSQTIVSASFPGAGPSDPRFINTYNNSPNDPILNSLNDTRTTISQKPRSKIIEYSIANGDTLSSIANKFDISVDTIKWANSLTGDSIHVNQTLKILPVSGVSHVVKKGDTIQSVAKEYHAQAQAILDFPFNDIPDDLSLKIGQELIIPDGIEPGASVSQSNLTEKIVSPPANLPSSPYLREMPSSNLPGFVAPGGATFIWPTKGVITQDFSWYHPGIDIANNSAPPIVAAASGVVVVAGWPDNYGLGNRVVIDHGNGYTTTYGHMSNIYVTVGQKVTTGQVIGQMGDTGRSTGTHCHFEIRYKGIAINPLAILK